MKKLIFTIIIFLLASNVKALTTEEINQLKADIETLEIEVNDLNNIDDLYPIGSIYISTDSTNPGTIIGGTWTAYGQGRKVVGVGSNGTTTYSYNATSGSTTKTLTLANLPAHTHTLTPTGTIKSTFTGTAATTSSAGGHTHTAPWKTSSTETSGYKLKKESVHYTNRILVNQGSTLTTDLYITSSESGNHSHTLTAKGSVSSTFSGTSADTNVRGSGTAVSVLNPYITVYMWKRTG